MRAALELEGVGSTVAGRYEILELLGRGGMGAVYRARDGRTNAVVALKRSYARDPQRARKRRALLEREYHTLAQLAHPRIIEVFDYGVDERGPYYTMELLAGADLTARGQLPWREACALLRDVASSLAILHSRGLIHRDVSTRNVRSAEGGNAKLFDFGAMASMGVAKDVVGTPPFVPPEALQMQALDARVDLYSLGALGYYLLTGRHAYGARTLAELRDLWRSTPSPPSRFVPDLPPALNLLIVQLLALDRNARPHSAVDVMKRLCVIAGLREEEQGAASRAYLTAPSLVGREKALLAARRKMLSLVRGDGGSLIIEDVSGSGRSRMLDQCVLEAKLIGAMVVRADANDGASGDWGVARTLAAQLVELLPQQAREAMRLSRDVLGHVIDNARDDTTVPLSAATPEHNMLIRELRDFVLALAQVQRLVIAVDDADRIDEPSASLLAALAHKSERNPLLIALCVDSASKREASASLRLLRMVSTPIALDPLQPEQTESLLRSVFGDTGHVSLVAGRVHELSHGNPRTAMELCQHLVSKNLARYEDGSWSLPAQLDERDLPSSLAASLAARLDELSADARALAEVLSLCDDDAYTIAGYPELCAQPDPARVFAALDELVAARVLIADADRYRFSQRGFLSVLQAAMPRASRVRVNARIAELLATTGGDVLARARHLLDAEREREAVALLCSTDLLSRLPPLPLLERAVERAEQLPLHARELYRLRIALLSRASLALAADSFRRAAPKVLAQLEHDSGLLCYRELAHVPAGERLSQALTQTQQRFLAANDDARVLSFVDAIRELGRLVGVFCSMAIPTFDLELLESLPSLEPLKSLSPALGVIDELLGAAKDLTIGRRRAGLAAYGRVLQRIAQPDRGGLDEVQHARTRLGVIFGLGLLDAASGMGSAERHAHVLEQERELRANAWRIRMTMHLAQGNAVEARKCQRRGELLALQDGGGERYLGTGAGFVFDAHSAAGDIIGVEESLRTLELLGRDHPGWTPLLFYAQARYCQLKGDLAGALEHVQAGLQLALPGRHVYFANLGALHVSLLSELGNAADAAALAREYVAICEREQVISDDHLLRVNHALALRGVGQHAEAVAIMERALAAAEQLGRSGLSLGLLYEARARIAIGCDDRAGFERAAERCAQEYALARNPALNLKFAALMAEAQARKLAPLAPLPEAQELALASQQNDSEYATVHSRIAECVGAADRARCALTIVLQSFDSFAGYLYGVNRDQLALLTGLPEGERDPELDRFAHACLISELDAAANTATATADGGSEPESTNDELPSRFVDHDGRCFEPLLLVSSGAAPVRAAALLLLQYPPGPRTLGNRALLNEIADLLLRNADVAGSAL